MRIRAHAPYAHWYVSVHNPCLCWRTLGHGVPARIYVQALAPCPCVHDAPVGGNKHNFSDRDLKIPILKGRTHLLQQGLRWLAATPLLVRSETFFNREPCTGGDLMPFGKDNKGVILRESRSQALGALGAQTGIFVGTKLNIADDYRMLKLELLATLEDVTPDEAQLLCLYLVDGDLSLAEAELGIETDGPLDRNDSISHAITERYVQLIGVITETPATAGDDIRFRDPRTNGGLCEAKPRWSFGAVASWNYMVYNHGLTPQISGATIAVDAKSFGVWIH